MLERKKGKLQILVFNWEWEIQRGTTIVQEKESENTELDAHSSSNFDTTEFRGVHFQGVVQFKPLEKIEPLEIEKMEPFLPKNSHITTIYQKNDTTGREEAFFVAKSKRSSHVYALERNYDEIIERLAKNVVGSDGLFFKVQLNSVEQKEWLQEKTAKLNLKSTIIFQTPNNNDLVAKLSDTDE